MSDEPVQKELIAKCCQEVAGIEGDAVEIGVHQGDSASLICETLAPSTVYLFDTFTGMPAEMITEGIDYHTKNDFRDTSLQAVKKRLEKYDNAVIVPGIFPHTAEMSPRLRFVHIDCDLYLSTKAALEWCWPLLVDGGVILDDDYQCWSCGGAKKAVDEFVSSHPEASVEVVSRRAIIRRLKDAR